MAKRKEIRVIPGGEALDLTLYTQTIEFILHQQLEPQPWYVSMDWVGNDPAIVSADAAETVGTTMVTLLRPMLSPDVQITKSVFAPFQSVTPVQQTQYTYVQPFAAALGTRGADAEEVDMEYNNVSRFVRDVVSGKPGRFDLRGAIYQSDMVKTEDGREFIDPFSNIDGLANAFTLAFAENFINNVDAPCKPAMIGRVVVDKDYPPAADGVEQPVILTMSAPIVRLITSIPWLGRRQRQLRHN